LSQKLFKLYRR